MPRSRLLCFRSEETMPTFQAFLAKMARRKLIRELVFQEEKSI
jgi:hypothetical protein